MSEQRPFSLSEEREIESAINRTDSWVEALDHTIGIQTTMELALGFKSRFVSFGKCGVYET